MRFKHKAKEIAPVVFMALKPFCFNKMMTFREVSQHFFLCLQVKLNVWYKLSRHYSLLIVLYSTAADGPGDRFIMGESQAGQQVTFNTPTLRTYYCLI